MADRSDDIIDRRRLRRKLSFWRIAAFVLAAAAVAIGAYRMSGDLGLSTAADHIAMVRIEGTITEDEKLLERLKKVRESKTAKGVILSIDSPGGTTVGGEAIFNEVRKLAKEKPVVAQVGTLAASAGYMIASATDHIVARQSSIVGSIGVLVQIPNVRGLMEKIGVQMDDIKSAPLKAEPSPFNETTEEERAMMRAMIMDSFEWFVGLVTDRRPLTEAEVRALADGSVFTGRQALKNKLVDELGSRDEAVAWLESKGVAKGLEVVEWKPDSETTIAGLPLSAVQGLARWLGLDIPGADPLGRWLEERMFLDGLISLWQPAKIAGPKQ